MLNSRRNLPYKLLSMGSHKPRGLRAARKLKITRRDQRWADKTYNKAHLGNEYNKPFAAASHAKGIVLEKIGVEAKQPNSAIRKCVRVQLIKNGKKIAAFVPRDGCLNFTDENDEVLIAGFGRALGARGGRHSGSQIQGRQGRGSFALGTLQGQEPMRSRAQ